MVTQAPPHLDPGPSVLGPLHLTHDGKSYRNVGQGKGWSKHLFFLDNVSVATCQLLEVVGSQFFLHHSFFGNLDFFILLKRCSGKQRWCST